MTASAARVERIEPYLRPAQVNDLIEEKKQVEAALSAPSYIANQIQDRAGVLRHARAIDKQLNENTPKPYSEAELDRAVRREAELLESWTAGMPTQAEMRRNPTGAVDKHRSWEARNKSDILEWKNIRLRLHASGMIDDHADARDVANIERYRPEHSPQELIMRGEQIPGKVMSMPNGPIRARNVMSPDERDRLATAAAELELPGGKLPAKK